MVNLLRAFFKDIFLLQGRPFQWAASQEGLVGQNTLWVRICFKDTEHAAAALFSGPQQSNKYFCFMSSKPLTLCQLVFIVVSNQILSSIWDGFLYFVGILKNPEIPFDVCSCQLSWEGTEEREDNFLTPIFVFAVFCSLFSSLQISLLRRTVFLLHI